MHNRNNAVACWCGMAKKLQLSMCTVTKSSLRNVYIFEYTVCTILKIHGCITGRVYCMYVYQEDRSSLLVRDAKNIQRVCRGHLARTYVRLLRQLRLDAAFLLQVSVICMCVCVCVCLYVCVYI